MHSLIAKKFGTNKEHINLGTEFGMNLFIYLIDLWCGKHQRSTGNLYQQPQKVQHYTDLLTYNFYK